MSLRNSSREFILNEAAVALIAMLEIPFINS